MARCVSRETTRFGTIAPGFPAPRNEPVYPIRGRRRARGMVFHAKHHIATANNYRSRVPPPRQRPSKSCTTDHPSHALSPGGEGVRKVYALVTMSQFAGSAREGDDRGHVFHVNRQSRPASVLIRPSERFRCSFPPAGPRENSIATVELSRSVHQRVHPMRARA